MDRSRRVLSLLALACAILVFCGGAGASSAVAATPFQHVLAKASNPDINDQFGHSVAISGDTMVVGAPLEDSNATGVDGDGTNNSAGESGAAYVFVRVGGVWSQQAYLKASNTNGGDQFGRSVAIDGDTIVVGAPHEAGSATGVNGDGTDNSAGFSGAAYVFTRAGTVWSQQAYLKASNTGAGDLFGESVAIDANTIVAGASFEDSGATGVNGNQADNSADQSGAAYVFTRTGTVWSQQAYLKASNTASFDLVGESVAIDGDTIVAGATGEDSNATGVNGNQADNSVTVSGAAYVFARSGGSWSQQAYLKASNTGTGDRFGEFVAISGDTLVAGAHGENSNATGVGGNQADESADDSGAAYVFTRTAGAWSQQAYLKASNTSGTDEFGRALAISGDTIVVGAAMEDSSATGVNGNQTDNGAEQSGAAYVFTRTGTVWSQQFYLKASNTETFDFFGESVSIAGDTIVVGARLEDDIAFNSGAAYVFAPVPVVTSSAAGGVTSSSATLNGAANPNDAATTGWFRYDTTDPGACNDSFGTRAPAAGGTALGSGSTSVPYSEPISGLSPGTTYYFCAIASNSAGTAFGAVFSFTTAPLAPVVDTSAATSLTSDTATLNGSADPNDAATTGWFRYATTDPGSCDDTFGTRAPASGGTALGSGSTSVPYSEPVSGLSPETTYYFCAIASNAGGTSFGSVLSFTTAARPADTRPKAEDPKCRRLRRKLKWQHRHLDRAHTDTKRDQIQANILDTFERQDRLGCTPG